MAKRRKRKIKKIDKYSNSKLFTGIIALVIVVFGILAERGIINVKKLRQIFIEADSPAVNAQMSVHFIDVGQGDCTLVVSDGEAMLVDAGEAEYAAVVESYLDSMGITELKYVVGTHPHSDHIGAMAYIIENYQVENVILPKVPDSMVPTTEVYYNLLEAVSEKGMKIHTARDEELSLGTSRVDIYKPRSDSDNLNNYSVCMKITHGENTFLLTGDTEKSAEKAFAKRNGDKLSAKVYKMGHHGSETASSIELLDAVLPRYAVVSCAEENKYGHPHDEALDRVDKYADHIFYTYKTGSIIFLSDGKGLSVTDENGKSLINQE